jgi:hypothetical protein
MANPAEPTEVKGGSHEVTRPRRRLTLADGLILIAAAAAGFAIGRIPQGVYPGRIPVVNGDEVSLFERAMISTYWASLLVMLALIPLRLMPPRPPFRWIRRQPGFIACLTVAFGIAHMGVYFAVQRFKQLTPWANIDVLSLIVSPSIGSIIISAWLVLAVSGRWRPEATWIDRAGRLLAIAWILRYVIHVFVEGWR